MPRPNRIIFEGAVYHIYQRGNNRAYIFENPKHKFFLLKLIKEYNKRFDFQLLAYVIMDNHYHLIVRTGKTPIDSVMFSINNIMSKYLNRELKRTGHVFEGRYHSKLIETDAYLLWLLRYIHRNPIRAHICNNMDDYRWSSHFYYKKGINTFINTDFILKTISNNKFQAIHQYHNLMNAAGDEVDSHNDYEIIKNKFNLDDSRKYYNADSFIAPKIKSLDEILNSLDLDDESKILIKTGSKKRYLTPYKIEFIKAALSYKYTMKEIGDFLNVADSSICKLLSYHNVSI